MKDVLTGVLLVLQIEDVDPFHAGKEASVLTKVKVTDVLLVGLVILQNGRFIRDNPTKMDDFWGTSIYGNPHMSTPRETVLDRIDLIKNMDHHGSSLYRIDISYVIIFPNIGRLVGEKCGNPLQASCATPPRRFQC